MLEICWPRLEQYITRCQIKYDLSNLMKDRAVTGNRELEMQASDCHNAAYKVEVFVLDRVTREKYIGIY